MFDFYTQSMLAFLGVLALFFWLDRKNVERQGILLLRKTTRGRDFLTSLGKRFPGLWWVYGNLGVIVGFGGSIFISFFILSIASQTFVTDTAPPLALVLPSPTTEAVVVPGFIGVPFWFWIITIFLLILVHEGSHGLMAAREKVRIKTLGWGALLALPLAFVEPDEKQLKKEPPMKQLRVFAAGSFGNFVLAFLALGVLLYGFSPLYESTGVAFAGLTEGLPAYDKNLTGIITGVDDYEVATISDLSIALDEVGPGRSITIATRQGLPRDSEEKLFQLTTIRDPGNESSDRGYIGIASLSEAVILKEGVWFPGVMTFFSGLLSFIFMINLGVGLFNLLPIGPLDGGRMWRIFFDKYFPRMANQIMRGVTWVFILVVILIFGTSISQLIAGFL